MGATRRLGPHAGLLTATSCWLLYSGHIEAVNTGPTSMTPEASELEEPRPKANACLPSSPGYDRNFTIVLNTFRRPKCLKISVEHWLSCSPGELRVVWSENATDVPDWLRGLEQRGEVVVERHPQTNITNRFRSQNLKFNAVFSIDDDVQFKCEDVQKALAEFRRDERKMVGFTPRNLRKNGYKLDKGSEHANTVFVTLGGFLSRDFFTEFFNPAYERLRNQIDTYRTGEDLLMSFLYLNKTGLPVVAIPARKQEPVCRNLLTRLVVVSGRHRPHLLHELQTFFGPRLLEMKAEQPARGTAAGCGAAAQPGDNARSSPSK